MGSRILQIMPAPEGLYLRYDSTDELGMGEPFFERILVLALVDEDEGSTNVEAMELGVDGWFQLADTGHAKCKIVRAEDIPAGADIWDV